MAPLDRCWVVLRSIEDDEHTRCVDLFRRGDGSFGFDEFRRDPEDRGAWTQTHDFTATSFPTEAAALKAAREAIPWLGMRLPGGGGAA